MRMETNLQMGQKMQQKLAPQIIQSIEILQLPMMELRKRVDQELLENPVLEREDAQEETEAENEETTEPDEELAEVEAKDSTEEEDFDTFEDFNDYYNDFANGGGGSSSSGEEDPKLQALENSPAPDISLQDHLLNQLSYADPDPEIKPVCELVIGAIDRQGYLTSELEELAESAEEDIDEDDLQEALELVQSFDPPGVGARSLEECLLLQLDGREDTQGDGKLQRDLIENHFEDILENRYPKVRKKLGCSMEDLKEAVDRISRLNPVPGSAFGETAAPTLMPDVRVELIDGEYQVFLEDSWLPPLGVNRYYLRQLKEGNLDDETKEYVKKKLKSARWLIDAIEQRRSTLYNVSSEIMKAQEEFLDKGDEALKPLRMQEIADRAGVHVSTVSRAINDKYIQTPRGVYPLKHFFSGGLEKDNGEAESWEAVRQKLSQIVRDEDKSDPLSDEQISEKLEEQGISIARRTVSKYRRNMGIPSARKRKEY